MEKESFSEEADGERAGGGGRTGRTGLSGPFSSQRAGARRGRKRRAALTQWGGAKQVGGWLRGRGRGVTGDRFGMGASSWGQWRWRGPRLWGAAMQAMERIRLGRTRVVLRSGASHTCGRTHELRQMFRGRGKRVYSVELLDFGQIVKLKRGDVEGFDGVQYVSVCSGIIAGVNLHRRRRFPAQEGLDHCIRVEWRAFRGGRGA